MPKPAFVFNNNFNRVTPILIYTGGGSGIDIIFDSTLFMRDKDFPNLIRTYRRK